MTNNLLSRLDSLDLAIYEALILRTIIHRSIDGIADIGVNSISHILGLKPKFIHDVLKDLRDRHYIEVVKNGLRVTLPEPEMREQPELQAPGSDYIQASKRLNAWYKMKESVKQESPKPGSAEWVQYMAQLSRQHRERRKQAA